jgi:hypothetical protein
VLAARLERPSIFVCEASFALKPVQTTSFSMESVLGFLAAAAGTNEGRLAGGEAKGVLMPAAVAHSSRDAFAYGITALCLRFAVREPAGRFADWEARYMKHVDPGYYQTQCHRCGPLVPLPAVL